MLTVNHAPTLDWPALLEPSPGGSAVSVLRAAAARRFPWLRDERTPSESPPTLAQLRSEEATLLPPPRYAPAPPDHPNIAAAAGYLARWPAADAECRALLDRIQFAIDTTLPPGMGAMTPGSSSHSLDSGFGFIALTVDHALGAAQAVVHEVAHHKLRALGIDSTGADALIVNPPGQLFPSPIAPNRPLPMAALFHEAYSFLAMVEFDLRLLAPETDEIVREHILLLLARNLPKLEALGAVVDAHIATDEAGRAMLDAFHAWRGRALATARDTLRANGYGLHEVA